jgi:hypothetical protein
LYFEGLVKLQRLGVWIIIYGVGAILLPLVGLSMDVFFWMDRFPLPINLALKLAAIYWVKDSGAIKTVKRLTELYKLNSEKTSSYKMALGNYSSNSSRDLKPFQLLRSHNGT